jgi:hypothetical protein
MAENIDTGNEIVKTDLVPTLSNTDFTEQLEAIALEIEGLVRKATMDIAKRMTKAHELFLYHRDEGGFTGWVQKRLGYSSSTAYNLLNVDKRFGNGESFQNLETLPCSVLYLLAAPSAPEEAVKQVAERVEAGKKPSVARVKEIIGRAKGQKAKPKITPDDNKVIRLACAGETNTNQLPDASNHAGVGHDTGGAAAETNTAADMGSKPGNGVEPDTNSAANSNTTLPAPDRITALAEAVNQLSPVELCSFRDQLSPDRKCALARILGKSADKALAKIGQELSSCIALMGNPLQHKEDIHRKLAHMKRLADSEGKPGHKTPEKSNAHLDCGAIARTGQVGACVVESSTP